MQFWTSFARTCPTTLSSSSFKVCHTLLRRSPRRMMMCRYERLRVEIQNHDYLYRCHGFIFGGGGGDCSRTPIPFPLSDTCSDHLLLISAPIVNLGICVGSWSCTYQYCFNTRTYTKINHYSTIFLHHKCTTSTGRKPVLDSEVRWIKIATSSTHELYLESHLMIFTVLIAYNEH